MDGLSTQASPSGSRSPKAVPLRSRSRPQPPPLVITSMSPLYRAFFLYLEPVSTIVGAFYAYCLPKTYLDLTHAASSPSGDVVPVGTAVALAQLANLYVLFAINEALVLRSTNQLAVWRTLLFGLLLADFGHLYSVLPLGLAKYYEVGGWNAMDAGNIGFVYLGAAMRISFLLGIGVRSLSDDGESKEK